MQELDVGKWPEVPLSILAWKLSGLLENESTLSKTTIKMELFASYQKAGKIKHCSLGTESSQLLTHIS